MLITLPYYGESPPIKKRKKKSTNKAHIIGTKYLSQVIKAQTHILPNPAIKSYDPPVAQELQTLYSLHHTHINREGFFFILSCCITGNC